MLKTKFVQTVTKLLPQNELLLALPVAFAAGLSVGLAWNPWGIAPLAIVGLILYSLVITKVDSPKKAALAGILFCFGWFLLACFWITTFGAIAAGAFFVVSAGQFSVFSLYAWYWRNKSPYNLIAIPFGYIAYEFWRTNFPLGGFPWAQLAHSQTTHLGLLPVAAILGTFGLGGILFFIAFFIAQIINDKTIYKNTSSIISYAIITITIILDPILYSYNPFIDNREDPITATIIQPGDVRTTFAAGISRIPNNKNEHVLDKVIDIQNSTEISDSEIIIWPENSIDTRLDTPSGESANSHLNEVLGTLDDKTLFAGSFGTSQSGDLTNITAIYRNGQKVRQYEKKKLVPFGEYFPYPELFSWMPEAQLIGNMQAGSGPGNILVGKNHIGVAICFESAFVPMIDQALGENNLTDVLIVSTNNASFADSSMKDQHLYISRLRAVENARPIIHASLSGPSAFIDPRGTLHQTTRYNEPIAITSNVYPNKRNTPAIYLNRYLPYFSLILCILITSFQIFKDKRKPRP